MQLLLRPVGRVLWLLTDVHGWGVAFRIRTWPGHEFEGLAAQCPSTAARLNDWDKSIFFGGAVQSDPNGYILSDPDGKTSLRPHSHGNRVQETSPLKILAIESSIRNWSVALAEDETLVAQVLTEGGQPISRDLLSIVESTLQDADWSIGQIEMIAVSEGPGSFTGLRVGITAAKLLAFSLERPVVACPTLEMIAAATAASLGWPGGQRIDVVMDAQRSEVFLGRYVVRGPRELTLAQPISIEPANTYFQRDFQGIVLAGPGLMRWKPAGPASLADPDVSVPRADHLARWCFHLFGRGITTDPFALTPHYYRPSYAEEK